MPASLFGLMSGACFVVLFANVYKHGWHWSSVSLGIFLTALMASLAVPQQQRTGRWTIRYWLALFTFCSLGVYRFML
jgi:hypothetical protein